MTEREVIKEIRENMLCDYCIAGCDECDIESCSNKDAFSVAIKALEEVQQYRAIGTVEELQDMKDSFFEALSDWRKYRKIGTPEECRAAMEKQTAVSRELIEGKYFCPKCHNLMRYPGYCGCGQRLY